MEYLRASQEESKVIFIFENIFLGFFGINFIMTFITDKRTNIQEQEEIKPETIIETTDSDEEIDLVLPFRNTETQPEIILIDDEYEDWEDEEDLEMPFRNTETVSGNPETDSGNTEIDPEEFEDVDDISLETAKRCKNIIAERYWTIKKRIAETQLDNLQSPFYTSAYTELLVYLEEKEISLKSDLDFWENRIIEIIRNERSEEEKREAVQTANRLRRYIDETDEIPTGAIVMDESMLDEDMRDFCRI